MNDTIDNRDISELYDHIITFVNDVSEHIQQTPKLKTAFDTVFDSDLGTITDEAYFTSSLERIFDAKAAMEAEEKAKQDGTHKEFMASIMVEEILHHDLYIKFCMNDHFNGINNRISTAEMHELSPPILLAAQNLECLKEIGAHNIAYVSEYEAPKP